MRLATKIFIDRQLSAPVLLVFKQMAVFLGWLLKIPHHLEPKSEIVIMKMVGGGSLVIALPNLLGLKRRYPNIELVLVTTPSAEPFGRVLGVFDRIEVIDDTSLPKLAFSAFWCLIKLWRADTVIDLEVHSRLTTLFALWICSRNRLAFYVGETFWKRKIATHMIYLQLSAGIHGYYDQIFGLLDAKPATAEETKAHLSKVSYIKPSEPAHQPRLGISHACSELGQERQLTPKEWGNVLARRYAPETHFSLSIFGALGDHAFGDKVKAEIGSRFPHAEILNTCGIYAMPEVVRRIAGLDELWCVDSALLHVARAVGCRTVSFWGPTDPITRLRDYDPAWDEVHYSRVPCSPCVHIAVHPPCRGDNVCIKRIAGTLPPDSEIPIWVIQ